MKTKTLLITLVVVLVVLVGGLFLLKGLNLGQADVPSTEENIALAQVGEVTSMTQTFLGVTSTYEVAESGDWVCMEDDTLELDQTVMAGLASQASLPVATQLVTDDAARLGDFGLETPQCRVAVTGQEGAYTLLIGSYQEFNDTYYVQLEGQSAVYTVSRSLAEAFCTDRDGLAVGVDEE